jgi:multidrug efflux pump
MPVIGALIARTHIDPVARAKADIVMYPDKFDTRKVGGITGVYVRMMSRLLHYPLVTLPVGFLLIVAAFMFAHPAGVVLFPDSEPEQGTVDVIARGNYSPIQIRDFMREIESKVLTVQGVQDAIMAFGGGGGGFAGNAPPDTIGTIQLQLMPWQDRVPAAQIFQAIRDKTKSIPGLEIQIAAEQNGPPSGKAINLRVESQNYDELAPVVGKLRDYVQNQLGDAIDVEDGRPSPGIDWQVTIDRVAAAKYGIGVRELSPYVQLVTSGVKIGSVRPDDLDDEIDVRVRLPKDERSFDALDSLKIATTQGQVPVSNFIKRTPVQKVATISRYDGNFSMTVGANLNPGVNTNAKVQQVKQWEQDQIKAGNIPSSVHIVYGGEDQQNAETGAFIMKAFVVALAMIALVLLLEYNSFWQVFITISTVGMSLAGVMIGLAVTHTPFSMIMTGLGVVALAGIVVKNGIVLTDTYNHYNRDDGVEPIKAMLITISQRVRPVLLTATVTALGVIPMALNVEFDFVGREITVGGLAGTWFVALSEALVSGLFVSTSLTLIMVPVMIVAPKVAKHQFGWFFSALWHLPGRVFGSIFGRRRRVVTPQGEVVEVVDEPAQIETPSEEEAEATRHAAE